MKRKIGRYAVMAFCIAMMLVSAGKIVWILAGQYKEDKAFSGLAARISGTAEFSGEENASGAEADSQDGQETGSADGENTSGAESTYGTGNASGAESGNEGNGGAGNGSAAGTSTGTASALREKAAGQPRAAMAVDAATGILAPYLPLYEENPDFYGWLCIDGTKVNYPVMYTPDDPEYYLRRAFDGSDSQSGTPFLDASCTEEGNLYLLYGHRMKNRTMFGSLPYYEKRDYWAEHPYIYFDTLYEQGTYEIVAAFYSRIYGEGEEGFRYYQYKSLTDEQTFTDFKAGVEKSALYKTDEELMFGDKVLLLSTCSYHTDEGRFVVVAKKLTEE